MEYIPQPKLPYALSALEPHISAETLDFHYGKHHMAYYNKLKDLTKGQAPRTLEDLIKVGEKGALLNQAGQLYNHAFYWRCMAANSENDVRKPTGAIAELIDKEFGSFEAFKSKFDQMATSAFGSGWVFLIRENGQGPSHKLRLIEMHDGDCPINKDLGQPILCIDLWEHAYYIDYRNKRPDYITAWWSLVNWDFCNAQLSGPQYNYQKDN